MGGENEMKTTPAPAPVASVVPGAAKEVLRLHSSNGQQHFHDDAAKLKVAVPLSVWFKARTDLTTTPGASWQYVDAANETKVSGRMETNVGPDGVTETYELVLYVRRVIIGPTLKASAALPGG